MSIVENSFRAWVRDLAAAWSLDPAVSSIMSPPPFYGPPAAFGPGIRDCYGEVYQANVPVRERLHRGQYFTPDAVCDLMLAWGLQTGTETVLDTGCGTGAFLLRAYDLMHSFYSEDPAAILRRLAGIDIDPHAAALASFQLMQLILGRDLPGIQTGNFLNPTLFFGQFFDLIIGNPPYVRPEHLKQAALPWADASAYQEAFQAYLRQYPRQSRLFKAQDLYLSFLVRSTLLLKPGGRLVYITSNSWLNTECGKLFAHFLDTHYRVHALVESSVERWFAEDAAVNPVIMFLERKNEGENSQNYQIQWVRFKTPLRHWMPDSSHSNYWGRLIQQVRQFSPLDPGISLKLVPQSQAFSTAQSAFLSFYFRSSQVFYELSEQKSLWQALGCVGRVRYPLKTGINQFFYLTKDQAAALGIEPEFLIPVIKSTRHVKTYRLGAAETTYCLFSCSCSKEELRQREAFGALAYIEWGELQVAAPRQKRRTPVPWPDVPSVQGRPYWYCMPTPVPAHLLCNRFFDTRFFFPVCGDGVLEDQTFYGLTLPGMPTEQDILFTAALLNSTLTYAMVELHGRTSLGEGVLQYSRRDMETLPVPAASLFGAAERQAIIEAYQAISARPILPVQEEVLQADRRTLDFLVLQPLVGPEAERWQALVASELLERIEERRSRAKSLKGGCSS